MKKSIIILWTIVFVLATAGCSAPPSGPEPDPYEFQVTDNLVAYYSFSGNANDSVGTAHGVLSGDANLTASDRFGNPNSACAFDGTDDAVTIGNMTLEPCTGFAITLWMYRSNEGYSIFSEPFYFRGDILFCVWPGPTNSITGSVPENTWTHVAGTYDDTGNYIMKLYINGVLAAQAEKGGIVGSLNLLNLVFGERDGFTNDWAGVLDEVRVYNRVLTADEIMTVYQYDER